jgi:hypothetical protein
MKKSIFQKVIGSLFLSILFTQLNYAQKLLKQIPLKQQVENSTLIVEGKVLSKKTYWDIDKKNIYTSNIVEVYKVFKGEPIKIIEVITAGGVVGLFAEIVSPSLKLYNNDIGVFMLYNSNVKINKDSKSFKSQFLPYGSLQGYYRYNLNNDLAINPFNKKKGIATRFYNEIKSYTKTDYTEVKNFDVVSKQSELKKAVALAPSAITFTPSTVSAGTDAVLTIDGSGFGATQGALGKVSFANADDGGATFVDALDSQVLTWNDTQITVEVPSQAGTGPIQVTDSGNSSATSASNLTILYSELNAVSDAVNPGTEVAYNIQHVNDNTTGGYSWQMFTEFDSNASAKASFLRAFDTWRCESKVNWVIGTTTTTDVIADDGINVIRFDNGSELEAGVLGVCTSRVNGCFANGGTTLNWFVYELDIVFDDGISWYFGTGTPGGLDYDFESVALHELGHGHLLGHVINTNEVMHWTIAISENKRVLSVDDIAGASDVQNRSTTLNPCPFSIPPTSVMTEYTGSCGLSIKEEELKTAISIYPNPGKEQFFIKNESSINLEKVVIYDISGRLISENDLSNSSTTKSLSLVEVSNGIYFVNIHSDTVFITKKIVIE